MTTTSNITPTPDWRIVTPYVNYYPPSNSSEYTHYTPSKSFEFGIVFDYPSNWWAQEYSNEIGAKSVSLGDPQILTLATPFPGDHHPTPHDFGWIQIWMMYDEPGQTIESELAEHKQHYNGIHWMTVLEDYQIKIDKEKALVLEYLTDDPENSISIMFNRRVYFMVNNRVFEVIYSVAEKDRGGEFDQGFDYFLKSIKIKE